MVPKETQFHNLEHLQRELVVKMDLSILAPSRWPGPSVKQYLGNITSKQAVTIDLTTDKINFLAGTL